MSNFSDFFPAAGGGGGGIPKYEEFTASGTFTPSQALIDAGGRVSYLIVGAGGTGYNGANAGSGGAVIFGYATLSSTTACTVTVGAGGSGGVNQSGGTSSVAFSSAGGTDVTAGGGGGQSGTNYGSRYISNDSFVQGYPGVFGYGRGARAYSGGPNGLTTNFNNYGSGATYNGTAADGFVRITWFE